MRLSRNVVLFLSLLFLAPAYAGQPWVVRFDGIGPLRFGMTFGEVDALLGQQLKRTPPPLRANPACEQIGLDDLGRKGVWLMFVEDVFRRVDVTRGVATEAGVRPGDPVQRVYAAYPRAVTAPRPYQETEQSLTVLAPDGRHAIRFETDKGKIDEFFAGDSKQVAWIEGCL